jgi:tight adherence protein C
MDYIVALVGQITENPAAVRWLFIAIVSLAVASISLALMFAVSSAVDPMRKRMDTVLPARPQMDRKLTGDRVMEVLQPLAPLVMPKEEKERATMRQRLGWAGYRSGSAVGLFYSSKLIFVALFPLFVFGYQTIVGGLTTNEVLFFVAAAAAVGSLVPSIYVDRAVKKRQTLLRRGFPDALDLLIVCVEAGLGLKTAIMRVSEEIAVSHPALASEFAILSAELRAGMETEKALHNLAQRNGLEDIRGFAALLSQSMRFGTSVGETLRVYAEEFREKRMQKAEEEAGKLGVKLIFPMVVCIFPSFLLVAMGPGVLIAMRAFEG